MKIASETGRPVMRPLFYDFESDNNRYNLYSTQKRSDINAIFKFFN